MNSRKNNVKLIIALVILAFVCVGGVELAACSYFDPPLFNKITAPVVAVANTIGDMLSTAADGIKNAAIAIYGEVKESAENIYASVTELFASPEPEPQLQPGITLGSKIAVINVVSAALPTVNPVDTRLKTIDGVELLTGGNFDIVYYNQADPAWRDKSFGYDDIGKYGCGPTTMAMVISSMTAFDTDPARMASWAFENGYWASLSGSYHTLIPDSARAFGLSVEPLYERTPEALRACLKEDNIIVALMSPGHFTEGGHFILLHGVTFTGNILVADPNSRERSLTPWDPQLIIDELPAYAAAGGPLWIVSVPEN